MNICPFCERNNQEESIVCSYCGRSMSFLGAGVPTLVNRDTALLFQPAAVVMERTEIFSTESAAWFYIMDSSNPLVLPIEALAVMGRTSADRSIKPHLDLSAFDAYHHGVSARHAALQRNEDRLFLRDLGSTNGTYLNGRRLPPYQPELVCNGDEIYLGQLKIQLYFGVQQEDSAD